MTSKDIIEYITNGITVSEKTCDTVKSGDICKEVKKVAISMVPTAKVLTEATEWGADLIIVHEPLYYNHMDHHIDSPVTALKEELVKRSGAVIYRYHDHPHAHYPDMINAGFINAIGIKGKTGEKLIGGYSFTADEPISAGELAKLIESKLSLAHVRISGNVDTPCKNFALCLGAPGDMIATIIRDDVDCLIVGEVCEWRVDEYARDAAYLGMNKSVLTLGHIGSERDGMELMYNELKKRFPDVEFKYINNEEVYTYTDKI